MAKAMGLKRSAIAGKFRDYWLAPTSLFLGYSWGNPLGFLNIDFILSLLRVSCKIPVWVSQLSASR